MSDAEKKFEFAKMLRRPDEAAIKRLTDHFNAQSDLFTQCPRCKAQLRGTLAELKAHVCSP